MRPWLTVQGDWRRHRDEGVFHLYWCERCDYGELQPRPSPGEVEAYYNVDGYYTHTDSGTHGSDSGRFTDRLRIHLAWRFDRGRHVSADYLIEKLHRDGRVLDVGCGNGRLLAEVAGRGYDVIGVEPDPTARAVARSRGLTVVDGKAETLGEVLGRERFHAVILSHVLEHCFDPLRAISTSSRLLEPHGLLIVETPNNRAVGRRWAGATWNWLDVPRHLNFFSSRSLAAACRKAGLEPVAVEHVGYCRQFANDWIETEQRIWDCFTARAALKSLPRRNSRLKNWLMLARTCLASRDAKYDSVRVVARANDTTGGAE